MADTGFSEGEGDFEKGRADMERLGPSSPVGSTSGGRFGRRCHRKMGGLGRSLQKLAVLPRGNGAGHVIEVTLPGARLVLKWVIVHGIPNWYVTSHSGQLSHLPSAGREMSTDHGAVAAAVRLGR